MEKIPLRETVFDPHKLVFRIGELSKMTGVSARQLRYWEQKDYIRSKDRGEGCNKATARVYGVKAYLRVSLIKYYLDQGYTLSAAVEHTGIVYDDIRLISNFTRSQIQGIIEIDGERALDMGYFDKAKTQRLYAIVSKDGTTYRVKDV